MLRVDSGKTNGYIDELLDVYIKNKKEKLITSCLKISLKEDVQEKVLAQMMVKLNEIDYIGGYIARSFKRLKDDLHIDEASFIAFIHNKIRSLENPETFISEILDIKNKKEEVKKQVTGIQKHINKYSNDNKSKYISAFNGEIERILLSIDKSSNFDVIAETKDKLTAALTTLQKEENNYYKGLSIFVENRKSNSALQPLIISALNMASKLPSANNIFSSVTVLQQNHRPG